MNRNRIAALALAAGATLIGAPGCREATAPGSAGTPRLGRTASRDSVSIARIAPISDSVAVTFAGTDSAALRYRWTVSHGAAPWVTLLTTSGAGNGVVRWSRDPSDLDYGTWVDTISISVTGGGSARLIDTLTVGGPPPTFITEKRPWLPGERDSMISFVNATQAAGPFSFALAQLFAVTDSVSVVVPNPAAATARSGGPPRLAHLGQAGQTWILVPIQIHEVFPDSVGSATIDSLTWLGVFWYASPESTWIGEVIGATPSATLKKTAVNTTAFDASGGTSGVGGGEARASTLNYWEANSGDLWIKTNVCAPSSCANATFTGGPFLGGQWHGILVGGQLIAIVAPCLLPSGCTAPPDTFNLNFGTGPVGPTSGIYVNCIFPSPCTGPAPARMAGMLRSGMPLTRALLDDGPTPAQPGEKVKRVMRR